ncbi:hypothetical protein BZG36_03764 [Bifiguratus adelaidae]|uniref:Ubiquinone biosynthesis monooxygenase COQ6, mitochondrial n=1 Tax=Bifiguratus adelaidae TaxID=1938954 RepID=A0A261Y084_9FUNG|nr:hypothetical protein BZG36_03764 [Bifiguratus adelaidae]
MLGLSYRSSTFTQTLIEKYAYRSRTLATLRNIPLQNQFVNAYDVIILGGGVAGAALAASLVSSPLMKAKKIALVEAMDLSRVQQWTPTSGQYSNRVVSLTPASRTFLEDIGVWDRLFIDRIRPYTNMQVWDGISDARIEFDTSIFSKTHQNVSEPPAIAYMAENVNLQYGIMKRIRAAQESGQQFDIIDNTKVQRVFAQGKDGEKEDAIDLSAWPSLELSNGQTISGQLLIGADGANSPVRAYADIQSLGWDYDRQGVVATLQLDPATQNVTAWQRFLPTGPIAILPLDHGISSMVWTTTPAIAAALKSIPEQDFCALVNVAIRSNPADVQYLCQQIQKSEHGLDLQDEYSWRQMAQNESKTSEEIASREDRLPPHVIGVQSGTRASFPLRLRNSERYVADRIALVGDAAHTIHPLAGQGLNQGLRDVQVLSNVLTNGVKHGEDLGNIHLLSQYASNRYARNLVMLSACDKIHRLYSTEFGPMVWARSLGLRGVNAFGYLKSEIMKYAMGIEDVKSKITPSRERFVNIDRL